jgi:myxalamid-type polyketide synthase MxaE and MxaD/epothilone polyketide synthase D
MVVNDQTRQQLLNRLQQRMMAELGFVEPIDPDQPLNEVGLDSLRSVTLANNLEDEFGVLVSLSELISGPTINELVDHLLDLFAGIAKAERGEPRPAMTPTAAITAMAATPPIAPAQVNSGVAPRHGLCVRWHRKPGLRRIKSEMERDCTKSPMVTRPMRQH